MTTRTLQNVFSMAVTYWFWIRTRTFLCAMVPV